MKRTQVLWLVLALMAMIVISCGSGETAGVQTTGAVGIAAKDIETPAEDGGYGFEEIAEELGYQTYVVKEDEAIFFGDPRAVKGGTLHHITPRFPATLRIEGQHSNYVENNTIGSLCYEGLLNVHPLTLEFMPLLASHWKISDDKMKFWFRINPDARWSDGMPVVAEDVVATWDLHMDETILSPSDQLVYGKYNRPVAESKYIVSVECQQLSWRNLLYFGASMYVHPHHILKDLDGTDYLKEYQYKLMPGTGPYTIQEDDIINQESFILTRRDDYWAKDDITSKYKANFDKIKFIVVKDNTTLEFEKFKKGEADFFTVLQARMWVEECDFESVQKGWVQKRKVYSEKPAGTSGYAFNMRKWPFNDKRLRYAFTYLYNREKMNEEMYYNEYSMMNSLYSGSVYENPDNEKIVYNPDKAVQLLNEAGYIKRNSDGWLVHHETGQVLSFEIAIQKGHEYMVTPVQQMLKEYGIEMKIKFMDGNAMWKNLMERNYTVYMQSWGGLVFPNPETALHSSLADEANNNNITGFKSERVDELLDEYDVTFDQARRVEIIREIDGIYSDVHPAAWGIARNYTRLLYWDKFGYPDYMVSRYTGDYRSIFTYWWIDPEKEKILEEAKANDTSLPVGEVDVKYWPEYLKKTSI